MTFNLEQVGNDVLTLIKRSSFFPYKTGKLKFQATSGFMQTDTTYRIHFSSVIAPYVEYLEEGTGPHEIFPRKVNGFLVFTKDGKKIFARKVNHPGSTKHQGFIKDKCVNAIINYITAKYDGVVL